MMDSPDKNTRNNILNILTELGFKDTPQSRQLDPWMTSVLASQQQEEVCSSNKSSTLLPDISHSTSSLKNHHNTNYKKRPFNDLDSQNYDCGFVGKRLKNLSSKKQWTVIAPRAGLLKFIISVPIPAPAPAVEKELPVQLRNMILEGGSHLLFVTEKALTRTDVSPQQSRFSVHEKQVANEFLNIKEKAKVKRGFNVKLLICNHDYQPGSDEIQVENINLTKWAQTNSSMYALNKTWNPIVKEHKLRQDMLVQLWAFRVQTQLYFAPCQALKPAKGSLIT